jgi:hypothetical protein
MNSFDSELGRELATGCHRKVAKRLALKIARAVASGRDEDIALAQVLVPRLSRRIDDMFRKVGRYADPSYHDPF